MTKYPVLIPLLVLLLAGCLPAQNLPLIPYPRSILRDSGELTLRSPVRVVLAADREEDRFAAGLLIQELRDVHGLDAAIVSGETGAILIGRAGDRRIDAEIARRKLDTTVLNHDESYQISVEPSGALIASRTAAGVYYGVQTLRQLIGAKASIPAGAIGDWPALPYRALAVDVSRGPILTDEQMRKVILTAAEFKLNVVKLYMEHVFRYAHAPLPVTEEAQITPEMARRWSAFARRHHVELVPHQQFFGHLHHMLKYELYAGLGEIPHGSVLAPANEKIYEWIRQSCLQLADAFPSRFLHFGADETWELGEGQSRALAKELGVGGLYLRHMQRITEMLRPLGKRILFPSDVVLKHPEIIPGLPKELIVTVWVYAPKDDYSSSIEPFRNSGLNFFVCAALHNWNRVFPNFTAARDNINLLTRDGKKAGALGMVAAHWADDGEALFNMTWYGVVFAAAAAWQPGLVDVPQFDAAFDSAFYRNRRDHTFVNAIRGISEAHNLLRAAGVNPGANNSLFWADPFSRYGAETVRRAYPPAPRLRILAERAALDLAAAREKAHAHRDTLPFLEFAARRMDYLGMKVQFAKEVGDAYRAARTAPPQGDQVVHYLRRIRGMDGLLPSLRDYIHEVKAAYRDMWLRENRPYWLDNVLVRYDNEALSWVRAMQTFDTAGRELEATKTLPAPEKLGLYLP